MERGKDSSAPSHLCRREGPEKTSRPDLTRGYAPGAHHRIRRPPPGLTHTAEQEHQGAREPLDGQQAPRPPRYNRQTPTTAQTPTNQQAHAHQGAHAKLSTVRPAPLPTPTNQAATAPRPLYGQQGPRTTTLPAQDAHHVVHAERPPRPDAHPAPRSPRPLYGQRRPRPTTLTTQDAHPATHAERPPRQDALPAPPAQPTQNEEEDPDEQVPAVRAKRPQAKLALSTVSQGSSDPVDSAEGSTGASASRRSADATRDVHADQAAAAPRPLDGQQKAQVTQWAQERTRPPDRYTTPLDGQRPQAPPATRARAHAAPATHAPPHAATHAAPPTSGAPAPTAAPPPAGPPHKKTRPNKEKRPPAHQVLNRRDRRK